MSVVEIGQILALIGMVLLLWGGMGRQRARKLGRMGAPGFLKQQRWLHAVAFGFVIAGLLLMWAKK